jgi:hypothetical protein
VCRKSERRAVQSKTGTAEKADADKKFCSRQGGFSAVEKDLSEMWCAIAHPFEALRVWLSFRLALDWQFFTPGQLGSPACHTAK